jgi:hypothetical protein
MPSGFVPRPKKAHDKRFSLTRNFGAASLILPERFSVKGEKGDINGQRNQLHNFCTACTSSEIGADEWGKPMSMKFAALCISLIIGKRLDIEGASIDAMMKAGRVYGFLPLEKEPENIRKSKDEKYICEAQNWPSDASTALEAIKYRIPGGDFVVDGPYDHFDNFRSALYAHKPDNGISLGIPWYQSISMSPSGIVRALFGNISWHDTYVEGWEEIEGETRIKVRSWDIGAGDDSYYYFNRELFNKIMKVNGSIGKIYMHTDESLVEDLKERNLSLYEQILNLYYFLLFKLAQKK